MLLSLFLAQFAASILLGEAANRAVLLALSGVYLAVAAALFAVLHRRARRLPREGLVADLDRLDEWDDEPATH